MEDWVRQKLHLRKRLVTPEEKVLLVADTLLLILKNVDDRFILTVAKRVCKDWNSIIKNDKAIKARLFLDLPKHTHLKQKVFNPLLCERFPHFFGTDNPARLEEPEHKSAVALDWHKSLGDDAWEAAQSPLLYPEASWRRMHITNPPTMRIIDYGMVSKFVTEKPFTVRRYSKGLRMGELYRRSLPADSANFSDYCQRIEWPLSMFFQLPPEVREKAPDLGFVMDGKFNAALLFAYPGSDGLRIRRILQTMDQYMEEFGIEYSALELEGPDDPYGGFWMSNRLLYKLMSPQRKKLLIKNLRRAYRKITPQPEKPKFESQTVWEAAGITFRTREKPEDDEAYERGEWRRNRMPINDPEVQRMLCP